MVSQFHRDNLRDVSGLVAVITGGGTGIGAVMATTLADNGAKKVYIIGPVLELLEGTAKGAQNGNIVPLQGSITSREDLQRAVDHIAQDTGYIDLLVNNAGMNPAVDQQKPKPTAESSVSEFRDFYFNYQPEKAWANCLEVNVAGTFNTTIAFLELLDEGNKRRDKSLPSSQVIATGSVGGMSRSTPSFIYNASKAAVHHLMKNLGAAFIPFNIRTNVIAPGWFPTDMTTPTQKKFEHAGGVMPLELTPARRMGRFEEMAGTILYLASRAGGYLNGNVLLIDGGILMTQPGP